MFYLDFQFQHVVVIDHSHYCIFYSWLLRYLLPSLTQWCYISSVANGIVHNICLEDTEFPVCIGGFLYLLYCGLLSWLLFWQCTRKHKNWQDLFQKIKIFKYSRTRYLVLASRKLPCLLIVRLFCSYISWIISETVA